ncbi:glycosyltransferase family 2 protein [Archaeoglobus sp.]
MRVLNITIFVLPFLISAILTYLLSAPGLLAIFSYFVILGMVICASIFLVFLKEYISARSYSLAPLDTKHAEHRIAVVIATFDEDPEVVKDTAASAVRALKGRGDVFILSDATDDRCKAVIGELEKMGVRVLTRDIRRGYKAGAINDFLKEYGKNYTLLAIFDADQRPSDSFFDEILQYFEDEKVAFVQVPQAYTELDTRIGMAAKSQQTPFLRTVVRGRDKSAFSLGSGTVYRISALEDVGGLYEKTVTEDVATSLRLHGKGYKSVYVDKPLIWYGIPPRDLKAYLSQQSRWSIGGFQLLCRLLKEKLSLTALIDYIASWMYWFKVGPITMVQIIAPILFLLFDLYYLKFDPVVYLIVYIPFILSGTSLYLAAVRKFYSLKDFVYHQSIEFLAFVPVTLSFLAWLVRRERAFAVTGKIIEKTEKRLIIPYLIVLTLLIASIVRGVFTLLENPAIRLAVLINIFWAAYFIPFIVFGLFMVLRSGE